MSISARPGLRPLAYVVASSLLGVSATPIAAAAAMAHVHMQHPINVAACSPSRNRYTSGGFTPAFYPGGPYWGWPAVYGYNYYQYPVQGNPTLSIDYTNVTNVAMKNIEFGLVADGRLVAEVRDVGTFSPGARIQHEFGLSPNVFPLRTSLAQCVPMRIDFADGTRWKNPHLPALRRGLYGHPPV